jgi:hypothetical protein
MKIQTFRKVMFDNEVKNSFLKDISQIQININFHILFIIGKE